MYIYISIAILLVCYCFAELNNPCIILYDTYLYIPFYHQLFSKSMFPVVIPYEQTLFMWWDSMSNHGNYHAPGKTRQDWHAESLKSEEEPMARRKENRAKPCKTHTNGLVGGKNYRKPPYFNHVQTMVSCRFSNPVTMAALAEVLLLGSCCWKPSLMGSWAVPIGIHWVNGEGISPSFNGLV